MAVFSAGILRSNVHRVVTPPKAQAAFDRWSIVFFSLVPEIQSFWSHWLEAR